jgi:Uroporphyrinogen decarboxylase (URO-D)
MPVVHDPHIISFESHEMPFVVGCSDLQCSHGFLRKQVDKDVWVVHFCMQQWDVWSRPYIERIVRSVKEEFPDTPITLYANGSGGLLERIGSTGVDVVGLDWTVDMADARRRLGDGVAVSNFFVSVWEPRCSELDTGCVLCLW